MQERHEDAHMTDAEILSFYEGFQDVHVPETTRQATLDSILKKNEELNREVRSEAKIIQFYRRYPVQSILVAAAAFVLILFGSFRIHGSEQLPVIHANSNQSDLTVIYRASGDLELEEVSSEDISSIETPEKLGSLILTKQAHFKVISKSGEIVDEVSILEYSKGNTVLTVRSSVAQPPAPPELYSVTPTELSGTTVFMANNEEDDTLCAAWSGGNCLYYADFRGGTAKQFQASLEKYMAAI